MDRLDAANAAIRGQPNTIVSYLIDIGSFSTWEFKKRPIYKARMEDGNSSSGVLR